MLKKTIPLLFKPFLWSCDTDKMDLKRDKRRIIINVLNLGTKEAVRELFKIYTKKDIVELFTNSMRGKWNEKSLNF